MVNFCLCSGVFICDWASGYILCFDLVGWLVGLGLTAL